MADGEHHVKSIAQSINNIYHGFTYYCPCCGREFFLTDNIPVYEDGDDEISYCPDCGTDAEIEPMTWEDYFDDDIYNIEYRVASKHDDLNSVAVCVACGGPNIYIDTADCKVKLYWGMDYAEAEFSKGVADEITDYFNELWNCE